MKISINWLQEFFSEKLDPREVAEKLTFVGLEVEAVHDLRPQFTGVYVAQLLKVEPHPNADRLSYCDVQFKGEILNIVCGAKNMKAGDKVALATIGAKLPGDFVIKRSKIRGVESMGMLCSERELGLAEASEGIMILPTDLQEGLDLPTALGLGDVILEVNVTPNRGDCLSMLGFVREVAAIYGYNVISNTAISAQAQLVISSLPRDPLCSPTFPYPKQIKILDPQLCSRYTSCVLKNIKVQASPLAVQRRLQEMGIRPINNIVDATNYVMLELGHPVHAFDLAKLHGKENILQVRLAKSGEKIITLDGKEQSLVAEDVVIADEAKAVALAGVMGGENAAIQESSTEILLECASFSPALVRKTARRLGLHSESSYRFERFVDPNGVLAAMNRLVELIVQWGGTAATSMSEIADMYPQQLQAQKIILRKTKAEQIFGTSLDWQLALTKLQKLGFTFQPQAQDFLVSIPTFRSDVTREIDVIEEIIRMIGFENIPTTYPLVQLNQLLHHQEDYLSKTKKYFSSHGFFESIHFSFVSAQQVESYTHLALSDAALLANPVSEEMAYLRPSLIPSLVQTLKFNVARQQKSVRLFEVARTFHQAAGTYQEADYFACLAYGSLHFEKHFSAPDEQADFYWVKGKITTYFQQLYGMNLDYKLGNINMLHPKIQAELWIGKELIGWMGELHPRLCSQQDIPLKTVVCEIYLDKLKSKQYHILKFKPYSTLPSVQRDLNLIVAEELKHEEVLQKIWDCKIPWLVKVNLYDVYRGKPVESGKKALTYNIEYSDLDRTLTDEEVNVEHMGLIEKLKSLLNVSLRV